jgi:exonuclease SbcD
MRILHTGDWHVGRTLHRRQRLEEAREVLGEVVEITEREAIEVVLICGDVFEHYAPSAEAEQIVYRTLLHLRRAGAEVLVISGNHDNAKRMAAVEEVFGAAGVRLVPEVRRPEAGGVIELPAREGERVQVACLPWIPERLLFGADEMMGLQPQPYQAYAEHIPRVIAALCRSLDPTAVTVLAGHLFISGARLGGGERELTTGQIFAISAATLPTNVQYIALGHVHRPQEVPGAATPARYAGSLLQLDFGESAQDKSVTLVDAQPGRPVQTREIPLTRGRKLKEVAATLDELEGVRDEYEDAWLRVTLRCDGPQPGLADRVREILPNALEVRLDYPRQDPERRASELRHLTPHQLFERYYQEAHGTPPAGAVAKLFDELYEEVTGAAA